MLSRIFPKNVSVYSDCPIIPIPTCEFQVLRRMGEHLQDMARLGIKDASGTTATAATYRPMQHARTRVLMTRLLAIPDQW